METALSTIEPTPLAQLAPPAQLVEFAGACTAGRLSSPEAELQALLFGAGLFDLGWLMRLRITGADRVRWLNGMVTNTVKDLPPGHMHYTFLLNTQGRIQGDGDIYALPDSLLLTTDRAQAPRLAAHLDHYIIMDDVELAPETCVTALGLAGPAAAALLAAHADTAALSETGAFQIFPGYMLAHPRSQQYILWATPEDAVALWRQLAGAGAVPCGLEAVEAARVLRGVPRYGADIHDRSLPQETGAAHALNFNKGCYLGQEIVERVRSRGAVHRSLRSFALDGTAPRPGASLFSGDKAESVGELTSVATVKLPQLTGTFALGTVRTEAANGPLRYDGGTAQTLSRPPIPIP